MKCKCCGREMASRFQNAALWFICECGEVRSFETASQYVREPIQQFISTDMRGSNGIPLS